MDDVGFIDTLLSISRNFHDYGHVFVGYSWGLRACFPREEILRSTATFRRRKRCQFHVFAGAIQGVHGHGSTGVDLEVQGDVFAGDVHGVHGHGSTEQKEIFFDGGNDVNFT